MVFTMSVGDYTEDTILQADVYQFQSEMGVHMHMHSPAYRPGRLTLLLEAAPSLTGL